MKFNKTPAQCKFDVLYFEINEAFGQAICQLLLDNHFYEVVLKKDLQGKDRFICAQKK